MWCRPVAGSEQKCGPNQSNVPCERGTERGVLLPEPAPVGGCGAAGARSCRPPPPRRRRLLLAALLPHRPAPSPPCRLPAATAAPLAPSPLRRATPPAAVAVPVPAAERVRLRCWSTRSRGQTESRSPSQFALIPTRFAPSSLCPLSPSAPRSAVSGGVGRSGFALHAAAPHRFPGPAACPSPHRSHRPDLHRVPPVPVSAPVLRCRTGAASRLRCCSVRCGCAAGSEFIRGAFRNQNNSSSASEGPLVEVGQSVLGPNPHSIHLTLEPK